MVQGIELSNIFVIAVYKKALCENFLKYCQEGFEVGIWNLSVNLVLCIWRAHQIINRRVHDIFRVRKNARIRRDKIIIERG